MSTIKATVIAGTTTAGGFLGKSIGISVLGNALLGILPLAAIGALIGIKLVGIGSQAAERKNAEEPPVEGPRAEQ